MAQRPGSRSLTSATTDEGRTLAVKLTGPASIAGNSVRADQSGSASSPRGRRPRPGPARRGADRPARRPTPRCPRTRPPAPSPRRAARAARPTCRAAARVQELDSDRAGGRRVEPVEDAGQVGPRPEPGPDQRRGFGDGADLQGQLGDDAQGAERAGQELGEVVAGDVLDDPPAPFDHRSLGVHEADADDLIARPPRPEPPRPARVRRIHAAQRRAVGLGGIDQQPLPFRGKDRTQGLQRDPRLDGDRHVGGRVVDHLVERPRVERDARRAGDAAVVERRAASLGIDGQPLGNPRDDRLAERVE